MSRSDLLALSTESLAALANPGLVKRAQREIAAGDGPELEEDEAGVVTGRFKDGVVARLVPGLTLRDTPCSCGAVAACRHRVAVALAYPAWSTAREEATPWSPGEITDEELELALGKTPIKQARELVRGGAVVEVRRGSPPPGGVVPSARLPTCGVMFHVPRDLAYARCDCDAAAGCAHVAVAVWAFREADAKDPGAAVRTVELRAGEGTGLNLAPLSGALDLARDVLIEGVANASPQHLEPRFMRARAALTEARLVWPAEILDDLEAMLRAYRDRSARYSSAIVASLLSELWARSRAASRGGELPARLVMGADEARETDLDHVRLVSLGARVDADGRARDAEVFLADAGSGVVLVVSKRWTFEEGEEPEEGPALAKRSLVSRLSLGALASGQLVSRDVVRRANRSMKFKKGGRQSSVTPQTGAFDALPRGLLVADIEELERSQRELALRLLRPRVLTEAMRVIAVGGVSEVLYRPGDQEITAELRGAASGSILLARTHRRAAPYAIEAIAEALRGPAPLRFVSGAIRRGRAGLEIDPVMLVTDRVIVPDLEPERPLSAKLRTAVGERERRRAPATALDRAMESAASCLEEVCHTGLARAGVAWLDRAAGAAALLEETGLRSLADRMRAFVDRVREVSRGGGAAAEARAADAWVSASIRLALAQAVE